MPTRHKNLMPCFSVVICSHNRSQLLYNCISSLLDRVNKKLLLEIIVVDNASTDDTYQIISHLMSVNSLIKYVEEKQLGLSRARNKGWAQAEGQYVVFLDDDGEIDQGWLEGFIEAFCLYPEMAACGGKIIPKFMAKKPRWVKYIWQRWFGEYDLGDRIEKTDWVPGGNAAWRKDILVQFNGFKENLGRCGSKPNLGCEESELIQRCRDRGLLFFYSPRALMFHLINEKKLTLRYHMALHFGQGRSSIRWQKHKTERGFFSIKKKSYLVVSYSWKAFRHVFYCLKFFIVREKKKALNEFFRFFSCLGQIIETVITKK